MRLKLEYQYEGVQGDYIFKTIKTLEDSLRLKDSEVKLISLQITCEPES